MVIRAELQRIIEKTAVQTNLSVLILQSMKISQGERKNKP